MSDETTTEEGYTTIDQLDEADILNGSEAIHGIQNEHDVRITPKQIKTFLGASVAVMEASCATAAATQDKEVTIAGYELTGKDIIAVTFTYGNTYGDTTASSVTSPNLVINGTSLVVCDSRGHQAGKGCWNAGDRIEFRITSDLQKAIILTHDVRQVESGYTIYSDGTTVYNKDNVDNTFGKKFVASITASGQTIDWDLSTVLPANLNQGSWTVTNSNFNAFSGTVTSVIQTSLTSLQITLSRSAGIVALRFVMIY